MSVDLVAFLQYHPPLLCPSCSCGGGGVESFVARVVCLQSTLPLMSMCAVHNKGQTLEWRPSESECRTRSEPRTGCAWQSLWNPPKEKNSVWFKATVTLKHNGVTIGRHATTATRPVPPAKKRRRHPHTHTHTPRVVILARKNKGSRHITNSKVWPDSDLHQGCLHPIEDT